MLLSFFIQYLALFVEEVDCEVFTIALVCQNSVVRVQFRCFAKSFFFNTCYCGGGHVPEALLEGLPLTPCKVCLRISFDTDLCLGFKLQPTGNQGPRNPLKHPRVPDDWSCLDLFRGSHLESWPCRSPSRPAEIWSWAGLLLHRDSQHSRPMARMASENGHIFLSCWTWHVWKLCCSKFEMPFLRFLGSVRGQRERSWGNFNGDPFHSNTAFCTGSLDLFILGLPTRVHKNLSSGSPGSMQWGTQGESTAKQLSFCLILPRVYLHLGCSP